MIDQAASVRLQVPAGQGARERHQRKNASDLSVSGPGVGQLFEP
jgi:hypothetical protein